MKLILASGSPRRKEILEQSGIPFEILTTNAVEITEKVLPQDIVCDLAELKASATVAELLKSKIEWKEDLIVLGADTMVVCEGHIMGKPKNEKDALDMLLSLQGKAHEVFTGVCLILLKNEKSMKSEKISFSEKTVVVMYPMTEEEILDYICTKEPMDKAGSYAIQGLFAPYIQKIEGDYLNVVGLPIARICNEAKKAGVNLLKL